jgi:hypothetical protein
LPAAGKAAGTILEYAMATHGVPRKGYMPHRMLLHVASLCLLSSPLLAQGAPNNEATEEFAGEAREGAPERISDQAGIVRMDPKGKVTPVIQSKNGFTCTLMPDESRSPVCADERGFAWLVSAISQKPQPPAIDKPGIAYMAKGATHYETSDGKMMMVPGATGTKEVREPPHWMIIWPFDSASTGIPTKSNAGGSYIMFAGTPYSHLMVLQDPKMLKQ